MRAVLTIALTLLSTGALAAQHFARADWQQDYAQLKEELVDHYANLAWKASSAGGVDLPALDRKTRSALESATDAEQAADAIHAFVTAFHDGHFSELPYLASASFPVSEPESPPLDPDQPTSGCASLGFASTAPVSFSLPFERLPGFKLLTDGLSSTFRTGLIERSGVTLGIIRIQNFHARAFPATCAHAWADLRQAVKPITPETVEEAARLRWFQDMGVAVESLRKGGATALVIDVGNNSGGDDSGDWAPRLFTSRLVQSARLLMVDAPVSAAYFNDEISDIDELLHKQQTPDATVALDSARMYFAREKAAIRTHTCNLSWVWNEQRQWSPKNCNRLLPAGYAGGFSAGLSPGAFGDTRAAAVLASSASIASLYGVWSGYTYVVADKRSYSSAEMFAAVMQDNHIAKLVGDRTGGDGCGFMADGDPIVLRHSRLRFRAPNCMRLRADGTNEEAGVRPDLPVLPTEGESIRARGERALRAIASDAANQASPNKL